MYDIGRICIKLAGRDAKGIAVIVKKIDDNFVLIEGTVRRRKCNIRHLEPIAKTVDIKEEASHDVVVAKLKEAGFDIPDKKTGDKQKNRAGPRLKKKKVVKKLAEQQTTDVKSSKKPSDKKGKAAAQTKEAKPKKAATPKKEKAVEASEN